MAEILRSRGFPVYFDPGYELHVYAGNFGRSLGEDARFFPGWIDLVRVLGDPLPEGYTPEVVERVRREVAQGIWDRPPGRARAWAALHDALKRRIVDSLHDLGTRFLIVENGTLPENPLVTESLYDAIEQYGTEASLGRYVLWRDFDLMWSVERDRYGPFPYRGVPQLRPSRHIQYVVVSDWMRRKVSEWVPGVPVAVLPDRFPMTHPDLCSRASFRAAYRIPQRAILIARCTRVIAQKCIERDLRLMKILRGLLRSAGSERDVFLFITAPMDEDTVETAKLKALAERLAVAENVVWGDGLLPFNPLVRRGFQSEDFSIADLLHASDLSSFLTSYGFEGFGNPPGEAMAMGAPYVVSSYELYEEVYGSRGAIAPVLEIDRATSCSCPITRSFASEVLRLLLDEKHRSRVIEINRAVCRQHFSLELLEGELEDLLQIGV